MYPEGVERLFGEIPVGTPVTAVNQVTKLGWHMGELYLEAQPDFVQIDELEEKQGITPRPVTDEDRQLHHRAGRCRGGADRLGGGRGGAGQAQRHAGPDHATAAAGRRH